MIDGEQGYHEPEESQDPEGTERPDVDLYPEGVDTDEDDD